MQLLKMVRNRYLKSNVSLETNKDAGERYYGQIALTAILTEKALHWYYESRF